MFYPYLYSNLYNKINNWPLNFLQTGEYLYKDGYIMKRIENGNWWSNSSNSTASTYALTTQEFFVEPQNRWYLDRGRGFAIRCVTREG